MYTKQNNKSVCKYHKGLGLAIKEKLRTWNSSKRSYVAEHSVLKNEQRKEHLDGIEFLAFGYKAICMDNFVNVCTLNTGQE